MQSRVITIFTYPCAFAILNCVIQYSEILHGLQLCYVSHVLLGFTVSRSYIFPIDDLPDLLQVVSLDIVVL